MAILTCRHSAIPRWLGRLETFSMALALSFPVVALDQFLHTSPAQFAASPAFQALRWVSDALMALPLFAAAVWTGHLIADRMGLQMISRAEIFKRALLISGSLAVFLIPGWFAYTKLPGLTQGTAPAAAHAHGANSNADAYWVSSALVYALLLAPLAAAACWAAYRMTRRPTARSPRPRVLVARASVAALLLGGVPVLAWLLHKAANRADSSRVYYTSALQFAHVHSHAFFATDHGAHLATAGPPVTAAPFAFAYQVARAFQDGLIAQAVGLPVAALMLLWGARLLRDQDRFQQERSQTEEVAKR
jgi:hypothetical protein